MKAASNRSAASVRWISPQHKSLAPGVGVFACHNVLFIYLFLLTSLSSVAVGEVVQTNPSRELLGSTIVNKDGTILLLWREGTPRVPPPETGDTEESIPRWDLEKSEWEIATVNQSFETGRKAFYVVSKDADENRVAGNIVWLSYRDDISFPSGEWVGDVVWHSERKKAYVAVATCVQLRIWISIHEIDLTSKGVELPVSFSKRTREDWPAASRPLQPLYSYTGFSSIRSERVELIDISNGLIIRGIPDCSHTYSRCRDISLYLHLDLDSGEWTRMQMTEKEDPK